MEANTVTISLDRFKQLEKCKEAIEKRKVISVNSDCRVGYTSIEYYIINEKSDFLSGLKLQNEKIKQLNDEITRLNNKIAYVNDYRNKPWYKKIF